MGTRRRTPADLVRRLIDRGYTSTVGPVLRAILSGSMSGIIEQRLAELDAEAARLAEAGQRLTPSNPVVRALLADFEDQMRINGALVNSVAEDVQAGAADAAGTLVRQLSLPGFTDADLARVGVVWNAPDPEAVAQIVNYTGRAEWSAKLAAYQDGVPQLVRNVAIRGTAQGWGPRRIADEMRRAVEGMPAAYADQLARTLQLTALRDAQTAHRVANAGILEYQIRIATLDDRTCMACVALHGTKLPIDARIDDHHRGRCTSVTKVRNLPAPVIIPGIDWFEAQSAERQRDMMGNAAYEAWRDGVIDIRDYPTPYSDPLFGRMIGEASLKGLLGDQARSYYANK